MALIDENVERVHQARDALIKKYGGFDGWVRHLIAKSRRRELAKRRTAKPAGNKRQAQKSRRKLRASQ